MSIIKVIIATPLVVIGMVACFGEEPTPQQMAESDLKSCYRELPDGRNVLRYLEYHHAKQHCDTMKLLYETTYKRKFNY